MRARLRKKLEKQGRLPESEQPINKKIPYYLREDSVMSLLYKDLHSLNPNHPLLTLAHINNRVLQFNPEFYIQNPDINQDSEINRSLRFGSSTIRYSSRLSDALKELGRPGLAGYR